MESHTTVRVSADEPVESVDELSPLLEQVRDDNPDVFIVEVGDVSRDTKLGTILPYSLGYMSSAGYGLVDIAYDTDNEKFTFEKVQE
jgi:hypothetical protein